ncbi:altered inheritance rate of mitochondria protein 25 [Dorcoceras hygrometricum]|uniref:Phospholipid scramblase n=1 Tax=Dorcoceras hygrometricum TaxID=472368 RepID=A0A2Z7AQF9_9LAMI|nr:altered inheritance rate of mitochondria protein 25 [Dorcoceras hygrometricum]
MMNWSKGFYYAVKRARYSLPHYLIMEKYQKCAMTVQKRLSSLQRVGGCAQERNMSWNFKLPYRSMEIVSVPQQHSICTSRQGLPRVEDDLELSRDFFVQLWVADRKKPKSAGKTRRASVAAEKTYYKVNSDRKQPPTSQSATGILEPMSSEEAKVKPLLARSNLLITRDIEWANLVLGFEQENRYAVVDVFYPQSPVGFIREQSNVIARQLLRLRRPFVAYITDGLGNELFRVRRPFWWITSSIYAEINGQEVGVVHRRWHLWRRIYDLYLGNKQFAVVENPGFWNWTFTLKDIDGNVLAEIDRDWRGFGFEIFTDAGQYVIRFGTADSAVGPALGIQELSVTRSLTLSERAVAVALAVSLDNDYFSRHGGWGFPFMVMDD